MSGASLVHDDLAMGERLGDIAHATRMVKVDVCDHHGGEIFRSYAKGSKRRDDRRGG